MVPATSKKNIKCFADHLRQVFGLYDAEYFPLLELLEHAIPEMDTGFNYEIVSDLEMGADQANYNLITNVMRVRESVYNGACNGNGRDRFTIAHELGHYFLHNEVVLSRVDTNIVVPIYRDPEWQANTFASALMMPDHIIKNMIPEQIAKRCGASLTAAKIAFNNLQKANKND